MDYIVHRWLNWHLLNDHKKYIDLKIGNRLKKQRLDLNLKLKIEIKNSI